MKAFIAYASHDARHSVDVDIDVEYMLDKESVFSQRSVGRCWMSENGEHPRFKRILVDASSNELWVSIRVCDAQ